MTDFDQFWNSYPLRKGKGAARIAFAKALKKASFEVIMEGVRKYNLEHAYLTKEGRFVPHFKHPATWLNGECWADDYETGPVIVPMRDATEEEARAYLLQQGHTKLASDNPLRYCPKVPADWQMSATERAKQVWDMA